ncbi:MAG: hypothetical protein AAF928_07760 [Myxococcota bacterium]
MIKHAGMGLAVWLVGCAAPASMPAAVSPDPPEEEALVVVPTPPASSATSTAPREAADARMLGDDERLAAGIVRFRGVARPSKRGIDIRSVPFDPEALRKALRSDDSVEELFGAQVEVVAELTSRPSRPAQPTDAPTVQTDASGSFEAVRLLAASVVAPPAVIEGRVTRAKGLYAVGDRMVSRDDLAWALDGGDDPLGKRVRLWGQPRDHHCDPRAQCLSGGIIPMFRVGRGQWLP